jgi:ferredoxin-thioredoxin reductase catalytic subunit
MLDELDREVFDEVVRLLIKGQKIDEFQYKGYKLNEDKKHVDLIIEGLKKKDGYCPCRVQKTPENICCCTHFINDGDCCCKLWLKKEE